MKATELRIGNYVLRQSDKMVVNRNDMYKIQVVTKQTENKYSPIALTEDWLLKLGFEIQKNNFNDNFKLNDECSIKYETEESEKGWWYSNDSSDAYCFRLKKIKYVHQLQNLYFALTGEELTTKN